MFRRTIDCIFTAAMFLSRSILRHDHPRDVFWMIVAASCAILVSLIRVTIPRKAAWSFKKPCSSVLSRFRS
jgi:hypothetical protein